MLNIRIGLWWDRRSVHQKSVFPQPTNSMGLAHPVSSKVLTRSGSEQFKVGAASMQGFRNGTFAHPLLHMRRSGFGAQQRASQSHSSLEYWRAARKSMHDVGMLVVWR